MVASPPPVRHRQHVLQSPTVTKFVHSVAQVSQRDSLLNFDSLCKLGREVVQNKAIGSKSNSVWQKAARTSLRMLRHTVPEGYTLGWKNFSGNLHCARTAPDQGDENSLPYSLMPSLVQHSAEALQTRRLPHLCTSVVHHTEPICDSGK